MGRTKERARGEASAPAPSSSKSSDRQATAARPHRQDERSDVGRGWAGAWRSSFVRRLEKGEGSERRSLDLLKAKAARARASDPCVPFHARPQPERRGSD
jgi:alkylhydroperoxidase family enzyme